MLDLSLISGLDGTLARLRSWQTQNEPPAAAPTAAAAAATEGAYILQQKTYQLQTGGHTRSRPLPGAQQKQCFLAAHCRLSLALMHPAQVLGISSAADSDGVNRAYKAKLKQAGNDSVQRRAIEEAHSSIMMSALTARLQASCDGKCSIVAGAPSMLALACLTVCCLRLARREAPLSPRRSGMRTKHRFSHGGPGRLGQQHAGHTVHT